MHLRLLPGSPGTRLGGATFDFPGLVYRTQSGYTRLPPAPGSSGGLSLRDQLMFPLAAKRPSTGGRYCVRMS